MGNKNKQNKVVHNKGRGLGLLLKGQVRKKIDWILGLKAVFSA